MRCHSVKPDVRILFPRIQSTRQGGIDESYAGHSVQHRVGTKLLLRMVDGRDEHGHNHGSSLWSSLVHRIDSASSLLVRMYPFLRSWSV